MIRSPQPHQTVTLMLQDDAGQDWPLYLSASCTRFIGRYRRVEQFGPPSGLLYFLPGQVGQPTSFR